MFWATSLRAALRKSRRNHIVRITFSRAFLHSLGSKPAVTECIFYRYFSWSHFRELLLCAAGAPRRPLILGCTSGGDSFPRHQHDSAGATDAIRDKFGPARIAYFCVIYATSDYHRVSCHGPIVLTKIVGK
jgi:hypothetical protein